MSVKDRASLYVFTAALFTVYQMTQCIESAMHRIGSFVNKG